MIEHISFGYQEVACGLQENTHKQTLIFSLSSSLTLTHTHIHPLTISHAVVISAISFTRWLKAANQSQTRFKRVLLTRANPGDLKAELEVGMHESRRGGWHYSRSECLSVSGRGRFPLSSGRPVMLVRQLFSGKLKKMGSKLLTFQIAFAEFFFLCCLLCCFFYLPSLCDKVNPFLHLVLLPLSIIA